MWQWRQRLVGQEHCNDISKELLTNAFPDEHPRSQQAQKSRQGDAGGSCMRKVGEVALVTISILCLWIALALFWRSRATIPAVRYGKKTITCGNSTEEAKAQGCVFDLLANKWSAPQCIDPVTEAEYREWLFSPDRAHGPFPFFYDIQGKHHIENEQALSIRADGAEDDDRKAYTTREQHLTHCVYVMRMLHRAMEGKARLNDDYNHIAHTQHCLDQLQLQTNGPIMGDLVEECFIGFSSCTIEVAV